jgi:2-polyprenyl-3-methyl-5-hydroxy-6-metoxy-1,4-benzoquinol methylase
MSDLKEFYEEYWQEANPQPLTDPLSGARQRILWSRLGAARLTGGAFLDCGSGLGDLVAEAHLRGFDATGLEVSEAAIRLACERHPGCSFVCHSLEAESWPIGRQAFDVVTSFEVIEHLVRPRRLLQGAFQALRSGGYLAITTPYHGLVKDLALALVGFERHFDVEGPHIRFFTDAGLCRLVSEVGFRDVAFFHYGRLPLVWSGVFMWARKP